MKILFRLNFGPASKDRRLAMAFGYGAPTIGLNYYLATPHYIMIADIE
jgi:hypothetical protein